MSVTYSPDGWPQPYRLLVAQPYWEALAAGQLKFQRCGSCSQAIWPPHSFCPHCESTSLEWQVSGGRGTIYSYSTVMRGPTPVWAAIVPYTVGFVQMDEGYFLFTQIDAPPEAVQIGKRVKARLVQRGEQKLPIFSFADSE